MDPIFYLLMLIATAWAFHKAGKDKGWQIGYEDGWNECFDENFNPEES